MVILTTVVRHHHRMRHRIRERTPLDKVLHSQFLPPQRQIHLRLETRLFYLIPVVRTRTTKMKTIFPMILARRGTMLLPSLVSCEAKVPIITSLPPLPPFSTPQKIRLIFSTLRKYEVRH